MLLITGATGHTGHFLLEELSKGNGNYQIRCLVRENSANIGKLKKYNVELFYGDMENNASVKRAMKDVDTIIHLVNIKFSPGIVALAEELGVKRVILIHTTGMFSKFRAYAEEYRRIEEQIINGSKVNYVILRPTMIYGTNQDHNMHKLIDYIKNHSIFPVFGDGKGLMQPVHARDLAKAIKLVLDIPSINNKAYNIPGGSVHQYREILNIIANRVNPEIRFIYIPYKISILMGIVYNFLSNLIGRKGQISIEQIRRLSENKNYSYDEAVNDFGYSPISFDEGIEEEIILMRY